MKVKMKPTYNVQLHDRVIIFMLMDFVSLIANMIISDFSP